MKVDYCRNRFDRAGRAVNLCLWEIKIEKQWYIVDLLVHDCYTVILICG